MRENKINVAGFSKNDLADAVAAVDDWIDANQASFNQSLPTPFRTGATTVQKAALFGYVLWRRIGRLWAEEDG
ncbi:hypothetical protein [Nonomuraea sp. NPDC050310]|uniref:hypothetical protein n=1 Tax=Nonomuraea sp. NPDC050310 TaxID=3154935 RepID=UPI00340F00FA